MKRVKSAAEVFHQQPAVPISDLKNTRLQVARYASWLTAQSRRNALANTAYEIKEYAELASKTTLIGKRKVNIFAPFRAEHSALWVLTRWQRVTLLVLMLAWCAGLAFLRVQTLIATSTCITALYLGHLWMTVGLSFLTLRRPVEEEIDAKVVEALRYADWPPYTILCPLYREVRVVPQFVRAMSALDYPAEKLQILFLTEADDFETRQAICALALPSHFQVVTVPDGSPRTKPRACNYGLMRATGQYVVIFDAEDVPEPTQLKQAVLTFANHGPRLACVQAKLNFYNPQQNVLTRWFSAEYSLWFDLTLPGLQRARFALPLGGTSNHFPTQVLRALGSWDAFNVTEDCDLGLRMARYQLETVVLNSTTYEEANSQLKNWIRQRSRWIKGYMQTYLVNLRKPWRYLRPGGPRNFLSLQFVIGGKTAFLFLNPLLWILLIFYLVFNQLVLGAYQELFPKPLLYAGTFSLIFGNFFYIYTYLLACFRRKQYRLIKWALFIPLYWLMMSSAACMALFQLIVKPHYWEKTEHGLHLGKKTGATPAGYAPPSARPSATADPHPRMPVASLAPALKQELALSITAAFRVISTLPVPAFSRQEREQIQQVQPRGRQDPWLIAMLIAACSASIGACYFYFQQHEILLYGDAYSHMMLARRFFDSQSPGVPQLGGVWLPLPQMVMLPFIWNNTLWRTGLAGSFPAMFCYIVAACCIYLSARRLTHNSFAGFIGTLVFILNPNILYLQTTPLSEMVCIATCTLACYFFLAWTQDEQPRQLVLAAAGVFLATLARYDGWALFMTMSASILLMGWIKRQSWALTQAHLLLFGMLGSFGIFLWLLWNQVIFHDFLYFQRGPYSAQGQALHIDTRQTYHNLWQSIRYYFFTSLDTLGPCLFALALIALLIFIFRKRLAVETLAVATFLVPFAFYVLSLYSGQVGMAVANAVSANTPEQLFNARFGSEAVAAAAVCVAILAAYIYQVFPRRRIALGRTGQLLLGLVIIAQTLLIARSGIISVQDGIYGGSCAFPHPINTYLAQHYDTGKVLENTFTSNIDGADAGLMLKDIVYDGSGDLWNRALQHPAAVVNWIILDPINPKDIVAKHINVNDALFQRQFTLVFREKYGLRLYHRNGLPPLPTRPLPAGLRNAHSRCQTGSSLSAFIPLPGGKARASLW